MLTARVEGRLPQSLLVEVRGPLVERFGTDVAQPDILPDPVERWVAAVNRGLLGGASKSPSECAAAIVSSDLDVARGRRSWEVRVQAVDWGAFVVLLNLLRARRFEQISLSSVAEAQRERELDLANLPFSDPPLNPGFSCQFRDPEEAPELTAAISLGLASDEVVDEAISTLDAWAELILLGGYAAPGQEPARSGAFPQGAILYDESTVSQSFERAFFADLRAFNAVVSYAVKLSEQGIPVTNVTIR